MSTGSQPGKIACPHCGGMMKSPGLAAGSAVNCPKCGQGFRIGEGSGFGVKGSAKKETEDRSQGTGGTREGRRAKDEGRKSKLAIPQPPPPPQTASASNPQSAIPNPQLRKPDVVVDPNLLAPPPPRVKEKAKEVAVVCRLCGTRVYAPLEKIGQTVKCPDCHSRNEVPGVKEEIGDRGQGTERPTLEGTEEFGMSQVVERPKYRPLQAARGEYEVLSALDPAAVEHRLTLPGEKPRSQGTGNRGQRPEESSDGEIALAPVEERPEEARDPRSILPQPEIEPENPLYDGRYENTVFGDRVDPRMPDAWKQAPFLYGIVEFVARPSTLLRSIPLAILLMLAAAAGKYTFRQAFGDLSDAPQVIVTLTDGTEVARSGDGNPGKALIGMQFFVLFGGLWLVQLSATFFAIVKDTGNGEDEVTSWPDWNVLAWFMPTLYGVAAGLLSVVPGGLIAGWTLAASIDAPLMAAFGIAAPIVISWMVLFPFIYSSMLAEDSVMAIASPHTVRSLKIASEGWVFFYMYSLVLVFLAVLGLAMAVGGQFVVAAAGAAGTVAVALIYARLLGRLMWVVGQKLAA